MEPTEKLVVKVARKILTDIIVDCVLTSTTVPELQDVLVLEYQNAVAVKNWIDTGDIAVNFEQDTIVVSISDDTLVFRDFYNVEYTITRTSIKPIALYVMRYSSYDDTHEVSVGTASTIAELQADGINMFIEDATQVVEWSNGKRVDESLLDDSAIVHESPDLLIIIDQVGDVYFITYAGKVPALHVLADGYTDTIITTITAESVQLIRGIIDTNAVLDWYCYSEDYAPSMFRYASGSMVILNNHTVLLRCVVDAPVVERDYVQQVMDIIKGSGIVLSGRTDESKMAQLYRLIKLLSPESTLLNSLRSMSNVDMVARAILQSKISVTLYGISIINYLTEWESEDSANYIAHRLKK